MCRRAVDWWTGGAAGLRCVVEGVRVREAHRLIAVYQGGNEGEQYRLVAKIVWRLERGKVKCCEVQ